MRIPQHASSPEAKDDRRPVLKLRQELGVHPASCILAHEVHSTAEAAWQIERRLTVDFQLSLESEHVGSAYPKRPLAATADSTVGEVFQLFRAQRTGAVLVCDGSELVGVFTERDALKLMAKGTDLSTPMRDVMSSSPVTVSSDTTVGEAIRKMSEGGYRHLPIVDPSNKPVGMVDVKGIVHYLVEHFPDAVYNLPPHPNATPSEREGA